MTVIIVDDEKEACYNLSNILLEFVDPGINIAGIANSTIEAEALINKFQPDAVFLDIEMPNENAFQFLERISPVPFNVIFVTAYDEYALKAFKLNAIDYILKPISISELTIAVAKAKEQLEVKKILSEKGPTYNQISQMASGNARPENIVLKDNNNLDVVAFKDLIYIEAMGSYSKIYFLKDGIEKNVIMSKAIAEYEEVLPTQSFFRVHKTFLVNCRFIASILKENAYMLMLKNKLTIPISRRKYTPLMQHLKINGLA